MTADDRKWSMNDEGHWPILGSRMEAPDSDKGYANGK